LSTKWTQVPVFPNPVGPQNIPASSTGSLSTGSWNITDPALITNYRNHPDQCILVELDSSDPNVTFVNKSVKRNMWVQSASEVVKNPVIDARGFDPPPAGQADQQFNVRVTQRQEVLQPDLRNDATVVKGGGRVRSRLTWIATGCRRTGQFLKILGQKYEICEDAGAFGSIVEHTGAAAVDKWITSFEGAGVARIGDLKDNYRISVPKDGVAELTTRYQPVEKKKCFLPNTPGGAFLLFIGMVMVGLKAYAPRKGKDNGA
jgi:hypothetical protein